MRLAFADRAFGVIGVALGWNNNPLRTTTDIMSWGSVVTAKRRTRNAKRIRIRRYTGLLLHFCQLSHVANPTRISIVDDDRSVREGLSRLLSSAGFAVNTFSSAEEYLTAAQAESADCLLLDVRMPGKGGIGLQRQLVADHSEVPVIFITAHEEETASLQALPGNVEAVLIKPFSEEALLNAINNALTTN